MAELELQCFPDEVVVGVEGEEGAAEPHLARLDETEDVVKVSKVVQHLKYSGKITLNTASVYNLKDMSKWALYKFVSDYPFYNKNCHLESKFNYTKT